MLNVREELKKLGYKYEKELDGTITYSKDLSENTLRLMFVEFNRVRVLEINFPTDTTKEVKVSRKIKRLLNIERKNLNIVVDKYRYLW